MPDDFHAYRQNYPSGVSDRDITEHYEGDGDVEDGTDSDAIFNEQLNSKQTKQIKLTKQNYAA